MTDLSSKEAAAGQAGPERRVDPPTRAQQRRAEEFERLCKSGYTVCCGGGRRHGS